MVNKTDQVSALREKAILLRERGIKTSKHTSKNTTESWEKYAEEKEQASVKENRRDHLDTMKRKGTT